MFSFEIGQTVYYLVDNQLHSAPVLSRMLVENSSYAPDSHTPTQNQFFMRFGAARVVYATCHGEFPEDRLFGSREQLAAALLNV